MVLVQQPYVVQAACVHSAMHGRVLGSATGVDSVPQVTRLHVDDDETVHGGARMVHCLSAPYRWTDAASCWRSCVHRRSRKRAARRRSSVAPEPVDDHLHQPPTGAASAPLLHASAAPRLPAELGLPCASTPRVRRSSRNSVADSSACAAALSDATLPAVDGEVKVRRLLLAVLQTVVLDFASPAAAAPLAHLAPAMSNSMIPPRASWMRSTSSGPRSSLLAGPGQGWLPRGDHARSAAISARQISIQGRRGASGIFDDGARSSQAGLGPTAAESAPTRTHLTAAAGSNARIRAEIVRIKETQAKVHEHVALVQDMALHCRRWQVRYAQAAEGWRSVVGLLPRGV